MKKLFALLLAAAMCFSLVACGGTGTKKFDLTQELIEEKWVAIETGDGTFNFYKTGTGRFESSSASFDFSWEKLEDFDNCIRLTYQFVIGGANNTLMKDNVADYELVVEEGLFYLKAVGEGYNYMRISDYNK